MTRIRGFDMTRLHSSYSDPHTLTGAAIILSLLLPTLPLHAADGALQLDSARVTLSGASNVHPYEASTRTVRVTRLQVAPAGGDSTLDALTVPGAIEAFEIAIPAASLTSPREGLDKNMHKALRVQQFADITFRLLRLEPASAPSAFRAIGTLAIAGVTRDVALDLTIQKIGATLTVKGTLPLLMTDYGITPPKAMLGMLKTDPNVTVTFETVFSIPTT
jgi:polyisoprenoid-binding protein YceI